MDLMVDIKVGQGIDYPFVQACSKNLTTNSGIREKNGNISSLAKIISHFIIT